LYIDASPSECNLEVTRKAEKGGKKLKEVLVKHCECETHPQDFLYQLCSGIVPTYEMWALYSETQI
jgi:hypothetical protein